MVCGDVGGEGEDMGDFGRDVDVGRVACGMRLLT